MSAATQLMKAGLTNRQTPDIRDIMGAEPFEREKMFAYCTSFLCAGRSVNKYGTRIEEMRYPNSRCTRCGSAVMWSQKGIKYANK